MAAPVVRADYDQLTQTANQFGQQAEQVKRSLQQIKSQVDTLQGGDWLGTGAQAFYAEVNSQVVPTLNRLARALEAARTTTMQVLQVMKTAEDEAARHLRAQPSAAKARAAGPAGTAAAAARPTIQDMMKKFWGSGSGGGGLLRSIGGFFSSVAGGVKDFAIGVASEAKDMVTGLAHAVTNPIETIKGLAMR